MKIRRRVYKSGEVSYQLDKGLINGKRVRVNYETLQKARDALRDCKRETQSHGSSAGEVSSSEMRELLLARERMLEAREGSVLGAVDYYLAHARKIKERVSVSVLVDRFIQSRKEIEASKRYVEQLGTSIGSFKRDYPDLMVADVTEGHVKAWLHGHDWEAVTRNHYLSDIKTLWNWAIETEKLAAISPASSLVKAIEKDSEIQVLSPEDCHDLLSAALGNTEMTGYVVLALLGGVRRAEIERLDWSAVEFTEGSSEIGSKFAKGRKRRAVELSPNAMQWLQCCPQGEGKICQPGFTERWITFRRALGWQSGNDLCKEMSVARREVVATVPVTRGEWPSNALRHTYASAHYAIHQNEALLQAQMGHRDKDQLFQNYRRLVTKASAARFWALCPPPDKLLWCPVSRGTV